jgi:hypothetical protein
MKYGSAIHSFFDLIVMKVLISCTQNPKKFIEVLDEFFIDKKMIFDSAVRRLSANLLSA